MSEKTLKEEVQEQIETEEVQEVQEQEQEVQPTEEVATEQPEIKEETPEQQAFREGQDRMKEQMQTALNKRISKEVGKRKQIENRFNEVAQEVEELKKNLIKEKPLPKREDFDTDEQWVAAMIDKKYGNKVQPQATQQHTLSPMAQDFTTKEMDYAKKHPDYYENLKNLAPFMNADLQECLFEAGPEVADYLANNIDLAEQVSASRPSTMGRAIARIEDNFKRTQPLPKRAKPKAEPVTETGATTSTNNLASSNQYEYNRQRAKMDGYIK